MDFVVFNKTNADTMRSVLGPLWTALCNDTQKITAVVSAAELIADEMELNAGRYVDTLSVNKCPDGLIRFYSAFVIHDADISPVVVNMQDGLRLDVDHVELDQVDSPLSYSIQLDNPPETIPFITTGIHNGTMLCEGLDYTYEGKVLKLRQHPKEYGFINRVSFKGSSVGNEYVMFGAGCVYNQSVFYERYSFFLPPETTRPCAEAIWSLMTSDLTLNKVTAALQQGAGVRGILNPTLPVIDKWVEGGYTWVAQQDNLCRFPSNLSVTLNVDDIPSDATGCGEVSLLTTPESSAAAFPAYFIDPAIMSNKVKQGLLLLNHNVPFTFEWWPSEEGTAFLTGAGGELMYQVIDGENYILTENGIDGEVYAKIPVFALGGSIEDKKAFYHALAKSTAGYNVDFEEVLAGYSTLNPYLFVFDTLMSSIPLVALFKDTVNLKLENNIPLFTALSNNILAGTPFIPLMLTNVESELEYDIEETVTPCIVYNISEEINDIPEDNLRVTGMVV